MIPTYTDITNWPQSHFLQTGGTREKCWVLNPQDGKRYFFKVSLKKIKIDYKSEFWTEIIASKFGQSLGLKMLDYNIARLGDKIGCLSQNMCEDGFDLIELKRVLTGFDGTYNPASKEDQSRYNIDFLYGALDDRGLLHTFEQFIRVLIFDAIIGNGDRHQDNWGFIKPSADTISKLPWWKRILNPRMKIFVSELSWAVAKFAPIYDSGSCLAHELTDEKVANMLRNELQLKAYINRGKPELRLKDEKTTYVDLLYNLLKGQHGDIVKRNLNDILTHYNKQALNEIVNHVDDNLPEKYAEYKLTSQRKQLIIKLIDLRVEGLKKLNHE